MVNPHPVLKKFDIATERHEGQLKQKHHQELEQFAGEFGSPFRDDGLDHDEQQRLFEARLRLGTRLVTKQKIEQEVFREDRAIARSGLECWAIAAAVAAAERGEPDHGDIIAGVAQTEDGVESASVPGAEAVVEPAQGDGTGEIATPDAEQQTEADRAAELEPVTPETEAGQVAEPDQAPEPEPGPIGDLIGSMLRTGDVPEAEPTAEPGRAPELEPEQEPAGDVIDGSSTAVATPEPEAVPDAEADQGAEPDRAPESEPASSGDLIDSTSTPVVTPEPEQKAVVEMEAPDRTTESEPAPLGDILGSVLSAPRSWMNRIGPEMPNRSRP
jgi:hypothetical protein